MSNGWRIEPLTKRHDRSGFACGAEALDRYLQNQAGQDVRRRVASVYVLGAADSDAVLGYYTLSAYALQLAELPEPAQKKLPRYPRLPAILLGRLAVDQSQRGRGHGARLLVDALRRSLAISDELAAAVVVVHAKDAAARGFYEHFGFLPLADHPLHLYLALETVRKLG